jgi:hypothetical protein
MLNARELATVLAALRYWQREGLLADRCAEARIADDGGKFEPLSKMEIDALCERINIEDKRPKIIDCLTKALEWLNNIEIAERPNGVYLLANTLPNNFGRIKITELIKDLGGTPKDSRAAYKAFRVATVSSNANSFGLRSLILIAQDGEGWKAAANTVNLKLKGETINVPLHRDTCRPMWEVFGFEIPERLNQNAPPEVIAAIWEEKPCHKKKSSSSSEQTEKQPSKSSAPNATATKSRGRSKKAVK